MYVNGLRTPSPLSKKKDDLVATREEMDIRIKTKRHKNSFIHGRSFSRRRTYRHGAFRVTRITVSLCSATHCVLDRHITKCNTLCPSQSYYTVQHIVSLTDILHSATHCVLHSHITQCNTLRPWQTYYKMQHRVLDRHITQCNTQCPWQTYYKMQHRVLDRHITQCNTLCPWQTYYTVQHTASLTVILHSANILNP